MNENGRLRLQAEHRNSKGVSPSKATKMSCLFKTKIMTSPTWETTSIKVCFIRGIEESFLGNPLLTFLYDTNPLMYTLRRVLWTKDGLNMKLKGESTVFRIDRNK